MPVIVLDHLSEIEKRAYLLADNKLADLSAWDDEALASELAELRDAEIDLGGLGFSDDELAVLLADAESPVTDADAEEEIPEAPAEPVTPAISGALLGTDWFAETAETATWYAACSMAPAPTW